MLEIEPEAIAALFPNGTICPNCLIAVKLDWDVCDVPSNLSRWNSIYTTDQSYPSTPWVIFGDECAACRLLVAYLCQVEIRQGLHILKPETLRLVLPESKKRDVERFENEIPQTLLDDYKEAVQVVESSPKAAAVLVRRALQGVLNELNFKGTSLFKQVEAMVDAPSTPDHLRTAIDLIRNFGNFGAHPLEDSQTLMLVDIEPNEAECCIQLLEELFMFYYVEPARRSARLQPLIAKVDNQGKTILGANKVAN